MSEQLNLNIDAYNTDDLLELFNISKTSSKNELLKAYNSKIDKLSNMSDNKLKDKLDKFFTKIYNNLLIFFKNQEKNQKINKVFSKTSNVFENVTSSIENTKLMHPSPEITNPAINSTFQIKYPMGLINPIEKRVTTEILCLDSVFRDVCKYPETSDFVYELPNPIENVISMKLLSAEIPDIQETFSTSNLNNCITITMFNGWYYDISDNSLNEMPSEGYTIKIIIPDGHPPDDILRDTIQNQLNSRRDSFSFLQVGYDEYTYTLFFRFKTLIECVNWNNSYNINADLNQRLRYPTDNVKATEFFRMPSTTFLGLVAVGVAYGDLKTIYLGKNNFVNKETLIDNFATPPTSNGKPLSYSINFNPLGLPIESSPGWKLGFRFDNLTKTMNNKNSTTHNEIYGNNQKVIGIDRNNPKLSYQKSCEKISTLNKNRYNIEYYGYLSATTPYVGITNSYYYLYVNDFVGNYNDTLNVAQNRNVFAKSILAKLQLSNSTFNTKFIEANAVSVLEKTRDYFGPVTIKKLHIKLLDKYNKLINTKKADFSLTLQFEKLYSSVSN